MIQCAHKVKRGQQRESNKKYAETRTLILKEAHAGAGMGSLKLPPGLHKAKVL